MTKTPHYTAAGGVVTDGEMVLVLLRPSRAEIRLPKGHVEGFETVEEGANRICGASSRRILAAFAEFDGHADKPLALAAKPYGAGDAAVKIAQMLLA